MSWLQWCLFGAITVGGVAMFVIGYNMGYLHGRSVEQADERKKFHTFRIRKFEQNGNDSYYK